MPVILIDVLIGKGGNTLKSIEETFDCKLKIPNENFIGNKKLKIIELISNTTNNDVKKEILSRIYEKANIHWKYYHCEELQEDYHLQNSYVLSLKGPTSKLMELLKEVIEYKKDTKNEGPGRKQKAYLKGKSVDITVNLTNVTYQFKYTGKTSDSKDYATKIRQEIEDFLFGNM